jgi:hypothetical protein
MSSRREFITLLGGAAAWPLAAGAQQAERVRRIGVLMATTADDPEYQPRIRAFQQGLAELGWTDGRKCGSTLAGHDQCRRHSQARGGIGRTRARRHRGWFRHYDPGAVAPGDSHRANCVRAGHRPGRRRLRREPGHGRAATSRESQG